MARPPKEYQALTSLVDRLLAIPKTVDRRRAEYRKVAAKNPRKRGPKPKANHLRDGFAHRVRLRPTTYHLRPSRRQLLQRDGFPQRFGAARKQFQRAHVLREALDDVTAAK